MRFPVSLIGWIEDDLDEEFEDKAHLRNHLMVTLDRHFDDLEAEPRIPEAFTQGTVQARCVTYQSQKGLNGLRAEKIGSMTCFRSSQTSTRPPNTLMIIRSLAARTTARSFTSYRMTRLREVQIPAKSLRPNADNTFGSIRATDRTIDGTPTLFAEEIQSDWAIAGAKRGYKSKIDSNENALLVKQYDSLTAERRQIEGIVATGDDASPVTQNAIQKLNQINAELTQISDRLTLIRSGVPDNPFRGNWYKPVINNFLVKAAQEGKGGIGFPVGEIVKDRYNLANVVDRIESSTDRTVYPTPLRGGPFKTVTIDLKPALAGANEKQMSLRVDKDGLVRGVNADQYNRFIGKATHRSCWKGRKRKDLIQRLAGNDGP
jgi:hypothetical protein